MDIGDRIEKLGDLQNRELAPTKLFGFHLGVAADLGDVGCGGDFLV